MRTNKYTRTHTDTRIYIYIYIYIYILNRLINILLLNMNKLSLFFNIEVHTLFFIGVTMLGSHRQNMLSVAYRMSLYEVFAYELFSQPSYKNIYLHYIYIYIYIYEGWLEISYIYIYIYIYIHVQY